MGAGCAEIVLLLEFFFFFLVGEWRVRALGPFSAAWGSSCEPVFLLEEGGKGWTLEVRYQSEQQGWVNFFKTTGLCECPFLELSGPF